MVLNDFQGDGLVPQAWLSMWKSRSMPRTDRNTDQAHSTPEAGDTTGLLCPRYHGSDLPKPRSQAGPCGTLLLLTLVTWVVVEVERVSAVAP